MNNLALRALTGAVYVAAIVGATLAGQPWFGLLMTIFAALASIEFAQLTEPRDGSGALPRAITALTVAATAATVGAAGIALALVPVIAIAYFLLRAVAALYDRRPAPFMAVGRTILSYAYIAMPLGIFNIIESFHSHSLAAHTVVLMIFIMIWLNATGAYLVGSAIGRRRLFERLSPKKSWEGFFGGLAFCVLAGIGASLWLDTPLAAWQWVVLGIIVCVFSTWGDLFESLLKRNLGVKDSGKLMPGHGGILDRIDSLLFVAPATSLFLLLCVYYYIL
ncbi:MAG: phosphatidate cytidylyltransferase [Muribaculaceae bacterium]|nr:phosphatidate cytidylyltransferase [Muribaculaceae bacterium]